jgi:hypothetical protein
VEAPLGQELKVIARNKEIAGISPAAYFMCGQLIRLVKRTVSITRF